MARNARSYRAAVCICLKRAWANKRSCLAEIRTNDGRLFARAVMQCLSKTARPFCPTIPYAESCVVQFHWSLQGKLVLLPGCPASAPPHSLPGLHVAQPLPCMHTTVAGRHTATNMHRASDIRSRGSIMLLHHAYMAFFTLHLTQC
jgi:hypothetical protein